MTAICDNRKCTATATRQVQAEGLTATKRICSDDGCVHWARAWFDVMHPVRGGHSLSLTPIESAAS